MRALLVGVTDYRAPIRPLPFVRDDLADLVDALAAVSVFDVALAEETGRDEVIEALELFVESAPAGEDLVIVLSGHGVHRAGRDYLVPSTARAGAGDFAAKCVAIDTVAALVEHSVARHVLVLVDACREGIGLSEMAVGDIDWSKGTTSWPAATSARAAARVVATVYACSNGERARFVDGSDAFSIFSRALGQLLRDPDGPTSLHAIRAALQERVDTLTTEHGLPPQRVRLEGVHVDEDVELLERPARRRPARDGLHAWVHAARHHPLWAGLDQPDDLALREATVDLVAGLAPQWDADGRASADDPWTDPELAERVADRLAWLVGGVLGGPALSGPEVALLVALPFLHEARRAAAAAGVAAVEPTDLALRPGAGPERRAFERTVEGHGRLARRARLDDDARRAIGWWLAHRTLDAAPVGVVTLPAVPAALAEIVDPARVAACLRAIRRNSTPGGPLDDIVYVAASTPRERPVRERLVAALHVLAHRLAIDARELGEVVVDHVGVRDPVGLSALHATVRAAGWSATGRLRARCPHPAVDLALAEHVHAVDALLADLARAAHDRLALAPLTALPARASADLGAATDERGEPYYTTTGTRFRLADDRVQELLMGEQLYGDPLLAVRELYQNALDACRYRACRTAYLAATGHEVAPWTGRITFRTEDDPDGTRVLVCRDEGIGMGERELRDAFAHAGVRFVDLPEVTEERAQWARHGITLHPNSRFGIGVLSYFMLADDLTVTTCRLGQDGRPGRTLAVSIAGPGALFRIRDLGPGRRAGTEVRLRLRPVHGDLSIVDALHDVLRVAEFETTADGGDRFATWSAGALTSDPRHQARRVVHGGPGVWWVDGDGEVLADGLVIGERLAGGVVDLTGEHRPNLRVDRRGAVGLDHAEVTRRRVAAVAPLFIGETELVTASWLDGLADLAVADAVVDEGARAEAWVAGRPLALLGHCALDAHLGRPPAGDADRHLTATRLRSWAAAGALRGLRSAAAPAAVRPSDARLVTGAHVRGTRIDGDVPPDVPLHPVWLARGASRTGLRVSAVAARFRAWGYDVEPAAEREAERRSYRQGDEDVLLRCGAGTLLRPGAALGHPDRVYATATERVPPEQFWAHVLERLREWGIVDLPTTVAPRPGTDLRLLAHSLLPESSRLGPGPELLDLAQPVPVEFLVVAASRMKWRVADVVTRLRELGAFAFDDGLDEAMAIAAPLRPGDAALLLDDDLPGWVRGQGDPPNRRELVTIAVGSQRSTAELARRYAALGILRPPRSLALDALEDDDVDLVAAVADLADPDADVVGLAAATIVALVLGRPLAGVVSRLRDLALLHAADAPVSTLGRDDELILSDAIEGGGEQWRDPRRPIPLAHVVLVADRLGRPASSVLARLAVLGFTVDQPCEPPLVEGGDDVVVTVDGRVLDPGEPVPVVHVLGVAVALAREPADVVRRLRDYGYRVPEVDGPLRPAEVRLATHPEVTYSHSAVPVLPGVVAALAAYTACPPRWVADRLCAWGLVVAGDTPDDTWPGDPLVLSQQRGRGQDGDDPWLDPADAIPTAALLGHLRVTSEPTGDLAPVVRRLRRWGFRLADPTIEVDDESV